ncbi:MAG TPA: hypothetical protein VJ841_01215 [Candidatus Saccharimonadales bacterium]|nr:hypothetical protein [Candidatus Saccharimonadales bacterium]
MSRPKGSKNKIQELPAEQFSFTTEQRIELVADLIVEKIIEDQRNGRHLVTILEDTNAATAQQANA